MGVTARDVAQRAEVSVSTVSRALARPDLVSADTRARVAAAARDLGYVAAPSPKRATTHRLGLVVPDLENPFFASVAKGVQSYARQLGCAAFVADADEDGAIEADLVGQLAPLVDGVILCSPQCGQDDIAALAAITSLVVVNRLVPSVPCVSLDHGDGMRQALRHLLALGHRVIAYAGGPSDSWSGRIRRECFLAGLADTPDIRGVDLGHFPPVHYGGVAAADLALASGASAVVAHNDLMAVGLIQRLALRGVRVPADMSVVGCDDIPQAQIMSPSLTTVAGPLRQLARTAIDMILGPEPESTEKLLAVNVIVRQSTAEAPLEPGATRTLRMIYPPGPAQSGQSAGDPAEQSDRTIRSNNPAEHN